MSIYFVGGGLVILGALLLLIGRHRSRRSSVSASRGSIAIGGSSYGPVTNVNAAPDKGHGIGEHWITILAIITELAGIAVIIWHSFHVVAK
jgi:hypothetical protein